MAHVVAVFDPPLKLTNGRVYIAQACGRERADGRWEGWLEFVPDDGTPVLRSARETTQRNLADLEHWAGTLTPVYLRGALERTLTPQPMAIEAPPEVPAVYDEPAPTHSVVTSITPAEPEPVLDPFLVYAEGEEVLARRLAALDPRQLRTIIVGYDLGGLSDADLDTLTTPELVGWIFGAVRAPLAA
jgi:hypothetical protein